ncbi:MAG: aldehyde ferredoxin oxidoreductase family protein [Chloroflexi bacterium]|nr:aldehyde ferredoxin oxidoreductase family protein [Chloroflexota bacterium]
MAGWMGALLRIDLTTGKVVKDPLSEHLVHRYLGGRGLNSKILWDEVPAGTDPLGSDNKLVISGGPLNGTLVPGSQRFTISAKSPLTGLLGDSNCGGALGAELKYAGYDAIIVEGESPKPVYILIDGDEVEVRDAAGLWGKAVSETERAIKGEVSDPELPIICIGPAGERLVKFACVIADLGRAAGRTGMGAVFGAKKLKAIAVRGDRGVKVARPGELNSAVRELYEVWQEDMEAFHARTKDRPGGGLLRYNRFGILPTRNFRGGQYDAQKICSELSPYLVKAKACFSCPVPCDHAYFVSKGPFAGRIEGGLELAQLGHYGPEVGISEAQDILAASALTDELGVDIMEMSAIIAYVMECFEKGVIVSDDIPGVKPEWGNLDAVLQLIDMTVNRRGIGDTLAEGLRAASRRIGKGSERYAMHVKGLALTMRDARGSKAWALGFAVSSRGADHCRSNPPDTDAGSWWDPALNEALHGYDKAGDILSEQGKPEIVKWYEELRAVENSLEICHSTLKTRKGASMITMAARLRNAVTGQSMTERELLTLGERIVNLERAFNLREGLTAEDDTLPDRFLAEPMPDGPAKGQVVNLRPMVEEYYSLRGWDRRTGLPRREKLRELGLAEVADELEDMAKSPAAVSAKPTAIA